jgi:hypothetical protein
MESGILTSGKCPEVERPYGDSRDRQRTLEPPELEEAGKSPKSLGEL